MATRKKSSPLGAAALLALLTLAGVDGEVVTVSPGTGPLEGGTSITITGEWELSAQMQCRFGATNSVAATLISTSIATCMVPSAGTAPSTVSLAVAVVGGAAKLRRRIGAAREDVAFEAHDLFNE